ncbi:MAG: hypothetical protein ICV63_01715 [Coleofasciculus sp. Co-bin14]|nr:hypothetical protein [Coleofasciculus sp. Co-bin14]
MPITAEALWVWVDTNAMRPRAIPRQILDGFEQAIGSGIKNQPLSNNL